MQVLFLLLTKESKNTPNGIVLFSKAILLQGKAIHKISNLRLVHILQI